MAKTFELQIRRMSRIGIMEKKKGPRRNGLDLAAGVRRGRTRYHRNARLSAAIVSVIEP